MAGDNYYGVDPGVCWFFEHDGEARIAAAAKDAFEDYLQRNPPRDSGERGKNKPLEGLPTC